MIEFQTPQISAEKVEDNRGTFTIEPLDRGFGYTFGNSLRRVLLSSLGGAAVTSVRIEGVAHEFSTIKGVKEDVTDIVLNLKGIVCRMHSDASEVEAPLVVSGPGEVTAKDIDLPAGVEILNPQAPIAIMGNESASSPTKIRKSCPTAARQSVTNSRSVEACFMPTKPGDLSFNSFTVSTVTLTAARPGM